jgi:hypothetical protein
MEKIDVCINVFGKPYQTITTIKTLLDHSSQHIDKIYIIEESAQPEDYNYDLINKCVNYNNLIRFKPKHHLWVNRSNFDLFHKDEDYRLSFRYEYGLENTDKSKMLLIHNDVIFHSDVVGDLLRCDEDFFSIGNVGQCYNCPLFYENKCNGEILENNLKTNFNFDDVMLMVNKHKESRTYIFRSRIDKNKPLPLPECRVNEWCMLVNVDQYKKEVLQNKTVAPLGGYFIMDIGDLWFKQMVDKGYKFKNFNMDKLMSHAYFSDNGNGHSSLTNKEKYNKEESLAKEFYEKKYLK